MKNTLIKWLGGRTEKEYFNLLNANGDLTLDLLYCATRMSKRFSIINQDEFQTGEIKMFTDDYLEYRLLVAESGGRSSPSHLSYRGMEVTKKHHV